MRSRVSVVVPTFNRAHLISETLKSIISQSRPADEIIVVDDGSTDATEEVVAGFKNVRYLKTPNRGVCAARNTGVDSARFDLVAFCDSDDLWTPEKLEFQLEAFEREDVRYCFTNFRILSEGKISERTKFDDAPSGFFDLEPFRGEVSLFKTSLYEKLLTFQPVFPSSFILRKELFFAVGRIHESFGKINSEDLDLTLRCSLHSPAAVVMKPVVTIRKHSSNRSGNPLKVKLGELQVLQHSLSTHPLSDVQRERTKEEIAKRSLAAAEEAFSLGEFEQVRRLLKGAPYGSLSKKLAVKKFISSLPGHPAKRFFIKQTR